MATSFSKKNTNLYLKELKSISPAQARKHLLKEGYSSSSFEVPEYYKAANLEKIKLTPIDWNSRKKIKILNTKPLSFLTPKNFISWRTFSLIHPYSYVHIVEEITKQKNWKEVREILCKETSVCSYSTPNFKSSADAKTKAISISRWIQMAENDLVKDSVNFSFLIATDIKNFYPSIYTHSIAWAVDGKEVIKADRFNFNLLGNKLDKLFQSSREGQTNGIPVGSMVSDIVAEIILKDVDQRLSNFLGEKRMKSKVLILRYRDDYKILSKTEEEGKTVLKALSKILDEEYNLALNSEKTKIYDDILEGSFRDWSEEINSDFLLRSVKYENLKKEVTASLLKDILLKTYRLQKEYPEGRASITLLGKLTVFLTSPDVSIQIDKIDIHTIISILRRLSLIREEATAQVYLLLDVLFKKLDLKTQTEIIDELCKLLNNEKDNHYQVIWLYRICLSNTPEKCDGILSSSKSALIDLLKEEYKNKFFYDFEVFETPKGLLKADAQELSKFTFIDREMLENANSTAIDMEFYNLFKY